jgi:very-short-patch-repair endonuclease
MPQPLAFVSANRTQTQVVHAIARDQAGIVTRAQLRAAGVSRSAVGRAVRADRLHCIHRGIYASVAPGLLTEEGRLVAALLAAGEGALLSHGTAAWRWRIIAAPPSVITLAVPWRRTVEGLELHVSGNLRPGDTTHNDRFPTTTVARTLLDLATRYEHRALLRALAEAGHPGSANLRAALAQHAPGHGEMKSRLERRFGDLLIRHAIELPQRNQKVGPWTVDCLWRERRVVVELDGRQHERPHQADCDDDRDLWLRRHRYVARRYGKRQIEQRPDEVIADLLEALGYAAAGAPLRLL